MYSQVDVVVRSILIKSGWRYKTEYIYFME